MIQIYENGNQILHINISGLDEVTKSYNEYLENKGKHPDNENYKWETKEQLRNRVMSVINKYKDNYNTIIMVAHMVAFQSICDCGEMKPAQIFEMDF